MNFDPMAQIVRRILTSTRGVEGLVSFSIYDILYKVRVAHYGYVEYFLASV